MRIFSALYASSASTGHKFPTLLFRRLYALVESSHISSAGAAADRRFSPMDAEASLRKVLNDKQSAVEAQGNAVRAMKAAKASKSEIDAAIEALNSLKLEKSSIEKELLAAVSGGAGDSSVSREAFRKTVANTLERRLFYTKSFGIYGGVAGLYDYGPPGCSVKANVLGFWRQVCVFVCVGYVA